jgi:ribosomal protein S18 acetylase RimI-like enzyme
VSACDTISVAGSPTIPGLVFRRFRGETDYPAMVAILNACAEADGLDYVDTVEGIRFLFEHLVNCDPYQDLLFAELRPPGLHPALPVAGAPGRTLEQPKVVAYSRVWWRQEGTGERVYPFHGFVDPAWRRRGLGQAMLGYNESRLRAIAQSHPPGAKAFQVWASDRQAGAHALFLGASYRPVRFMIEMVRSAAVPLQPAPMPAGLEVRPVRPEHVAAIWQARDEAYQDHWGYTPSTEEDYRRWLASPLFNPALWKVAWEGSRVAGMVLNRVNEEENAWNRRRRGYTQDIFVLRPWRRRGLARALLTQSIEMFRGLGMDETALGVDAQNPSGALALYESVGYREVRCNTFYRKALE